MVIYWVKKISSQWAIASVKKETILCAAITVQIILMETKVMILFGVMGAMMHCMELKAMMSFLVAMIMTS